MGVVYWVTVSESSAAGSPGCPGSRTVKRTLSARYISRLAWLHSTPHWTAPRKILFRSFMHCIGRNADFITGVDMKYYNRTIITTKNTFATVSFSDSSQVFCSRSALFSNVWSHTGLTLNFNVKFTNFSDSFSMIYMLTLSGTIQSISDKTIMFSKKSK